MKKKTEKKQKKYLIECNETQIRLIANALEQYSRMICGQLNETFMPALEHGMMKEHYYKFKEKNPELADDAMSNYCRVRDEVDLYLDQIKRIVWRMDSNASYGIRYDSTADLGYEMYKEILSQFEKEREQQCISEGKTYSGNVHTGRPLKLTDEPVMTVKLIEDEDNK